MLCKVKRKKFQTTRSFAENNICKYVLSPENYQQVVIAWKFQESSIPENNK